MQMANKIEVDVFNYFAIEVLEKLGIGEPDQKQIDRVAFVLEKVTKEKKYLTLSKSEPLLNR